MLSITDEMTVGEFSHFFDYLFGGKAEVRIHWCRRRQIIPIRLEPPSVRVAVSIATTE
ncbi:MAG: hypothetical protein IKP34_06175 [Bacteroidales bacterium]|nr:hypothetical protein [Bacteroidales bacterium]